MTFFVYMYMCFTIYLFHIYFWIIATLEFNQAQTSRSKGIRKYTVEEQARLQVWEQ